MHRRPRPRIVVPQATQMTSRQAAIANTALTMGCDVWFEPLDLWSSTNLNWTIFSKLPHRPSWQKNNDRHKLCACCSKGRKHYSGASRCIFYRWLAYAYRYISRVSDHVIPSWCGTRNKIPPLTSHISTTDYFTLMHHAWVININIILPWALKDEEKNVAKIAN